MKRSMNSFILLAAILLTACAPVPTPEFSMTPLPLETVTQFPSEPLVLSVTRTPQPAITNVPTKTPINTPILLTTTMTTTPVPPLIPHEWQPQSVLIKIESDGGDGCCLYSYPPEFVLYANGRLIISKMYETRDGQWRNALITQLLTRRETCEVLYTIDQAGYFDYDVSTYHPQNSDYFSVDGAGFTKIVVNAWSSSIGKFYALKFYVYATEFSPEEFPSSGAGIPHIPKALRNTIYFLDSFVPSEMELYRSERLGLVVTKASDTVASPSGPAKKWLFDIPLIEIANLTSPNGYPTQFYEIEGELAGSIYDFFGDSFALDGELVKQGDQEFVVFARPILPYEIPQFNTFNILPDPSVKPPVITLSCYPTDGTLPIPIPTPNP